MTLYSGRDVIRRYSDPSLGPVHGLNLPLNSIANTPRKNENSDFQHFSLRYVSFSNLNMMVQLIIYYFRQNVYMYDIYIKYILDF